jgi:hypothetical protein
MYLLIRWYPGVVKRDMYLNKISVHFRRQQTTYGVLVKKCSNPHIFSIPIDKVVSLYQQQKIKTQ